MTFDTPIIPTSTARTDFRVAPWVRVPWDGSKRYGRHGLNIFRTSPRGEMAA